VAPEYRRQGLAQKLMGILEEITIKRRVPALNSRALVA
jgi:ribosomal protein S18 acetylase RimI-like enzyme